MKAPFGITERQLVSYLFKYHLVAKHKIIYKTSKSITDRSRSVIVCSYKSCSYFSNLHIENNVLVCVGVVDGEKLSGEASKVIG